MSWVIMALNRPRRTPGSCTLKSANFKNIYVLHVLDVTNAKKSTKEWYPIATRAPETACNHVFQHFLECSRDPLGTEKVTENGPQMSHRVVVSCGKR